MPILCSHTGPPGWTTTITVLSSQALNHVPTFSSFSFSSSSTSQQEWSLRNGVYRCFGDIPLGASHCTKDAMQTSLCGPQARQDLTATYLLHPSQSSPPIQILASGFLSSLHVLLSTAGCAGCAILSMPSYPWMER